MNQQEQKIFEALNEGIFEIRPDGTIWRKKTISRTGRLLPIKPYRADVKRKDGYLQVNLGRKYRLLSHRVVWLALHGTIPQGLEINHKNGTKSCNQPDNLELVTRSQNKKHSYDYLNHSSQAGEDNGNARLTSKDIHSIKEKRANGETHRSIAKAFNVSHSHIQNILKGKRWNLEYKEMP